MSSPGSFGFGGFGGGFVGTCGGGFGFGALLDAEADALAVVEVAGVADGIASFGGGGSVMFGVSLDGVATMPVVPVPVVVVVCPPFVAAT